jgi:hypothetical protein
MEQYLRNGNLLDLALSFQISDGNLHDWDFVRTIVGRYGSHLPMLQICEEPNSMGPAGDGRLRDDYIPKPAFETYRRLVAELESRAKQQR